MARVTIEDCMTKVQSRFELVVLAAQRVKDIVSGAPVTVDRQKDKNPVVALREIANGNLNLQVLQDVVIKKHRLVQPQVEKDLAEEESFFIEAAAEVSHFSSDAAEISEEELEDFQEEELE